MLTRIQYAAIEAIKAIALIFVLLLGIITLSLISPYIAAVIACAVLAVSTISIFRPLPIAWLRKRWLSVLVTIFVGLPSSIGIIATISQPKSEAEIAILRESDTDAYLSALHEISESRWLEELAALAPEQHAAFVEQQAHLQAAVQLAEREQQREQQAAFLASIEEEITADIDRLNWRVARDRYLELSRSDAERNDITAIAQRLETRVIEIVRPISASELERNRDGYELLSVLNPENSTYLERAQQYAARIEAQRRSILDALRRSEDRVEGVTFLHHRNEPARLNSRSTVLLYIGTRPNQSRPWLRMRVQYAASEWLFVERVVAWHDGVRETLAAGRFQRDNHTTIWEWIDVSPTDLQLEILHSLSNANEAVLRFEGSQYRRDVTLSEGDKRALREMLAAFEILQSGDG